jgi:heptosyltransferase-2
VVEQWLGRETRPNYEVRLQVPDAVMERVRAARQGFRPLVIGINPGATYGSAKCWLSERFAELALRTHKMFDAEILLFGGPGDTAVCATVAQSIQRLAGEPTPWCTNLAGKTSLLELAAWLQLCEALVTNDTGTMHVAAAAGTRVVAIFGPTDWKTTAPLGTQHALIRMPADCAPCLKRECPTDHRCMRAVTTDMVLAALAAICRQQHSGRQ